MEPRKFNIGRVALFFPFRVFGTAVNCYLENNSGNIAAHRFRHNV